jgi:hypothetical protein
MSGAEAAWAAWRDAAMELHDEVDEGDGLSDILKSREVGDDTSFVGILDRNALDAQGWRPVYLKVELTGVDERRWFLLDIFKKSIDEPDAGCAAAGFSTGADSRVFV